MATYRNSWIGDYAKSVEKYAKQVNAMADAMDATIGPIDATSNYRSGGHTGYMGVSGSVGPMGQQGAQGIQGMQGIAGQSGYSHLNSMTLSQFASHIPADSIEDAFLELCKKYGVQTQESSLEYFNNANDDSEDWSEEDADVDDEMSFDEEIKTFTLDEIINIIESLSVEMNVNHGGVFEFTHKELIDKNRLKEILKNS